jgi:hypothetical protein
MRQACLLLVYRNIRTATANGSAIGLGVNALHTVRVLRRAGVEVDATPATHKRFKARNRGGGPEASGAGVVVERVAARGEVGPASV